MVRGDSVPFASVVLNYFWMIILHPANILFGSTHRGFALFPKDAKFLIKNSPSLAQERTNDDQAVIQYAIEDYFVASKMRELSKGFVLTPHSNLADRLIDVIFTKPGTGNDALFILISRN